MDAVLQTHNAQGFRRPLPALLQGNIGIQQRQGHIVHGVHFGHQVIALEDETDVLVPHLGQVVILQVVQVFTVQHIFSGGGYIQAADDVHQGAFAGAGGAHNGDVIPLLYLQAHVFQHPHRLLALDIVLADVG